MLLQIREGGYIIIYRLLFVLQEKVLHNIMPIFTFMGANLMRLDDAYSFRVIDKTVQMVIPALIQVSLYVPPFSPQTQENL